MLLIEFKNVIVGNEALTMTTLIALKNAIETLLWRSDGYARIQFLI